MEMKHDLIVVLTYNFPLWKIFTKGKSLINHLFVAMKIWFDLRTINSPSQNLKLNHTKIRNWSKTFAGVPVPAAVGVGDPAEQQHQLRLQPDQEQSAQAPVTQV